MIIAIDGPSGAGKSSVSKEVAKILGFACLDTGAMYRSVAWQAVHDGVDLNDDEQLAEIARTIPVDFVLEEGNPQAKAVLMGGVDVTSDIRTAEIDLDIGTVVFPDAELKIFLTASDEERARRRVKQNEERGVGLTDFEAVLADIIRRDKVDSERAASPLCQAEDAVLVDSTDMTMDEVVDTICKLARKAQKQKR